MVKPEEMVVLDRWAVGCAKAAQEDILNAYEAYDFHEVVQRLMRFCSVEMGSFYLDIIKDRQYTAVHHIVRIILPAGQHAGGDIAIRQGKNLHAQLCCFFNRSTQARFIQRNHAQLVQRFT